MITKIGQFTCGDGTRVALSSSTSELYVNTFLVTSKSFHDPPHYFSSPLSLSYHLTRGMDSTPDSPLTMTSSLEHATSTIDDLTLALANFSRLPSPDPLSTVTCCCKREDCENVQAWHALKSRLESRLTLSAGACMLFVVVRSATVAHCPHSYDRSRASSSSEK